jgi:hypothetical protein
MALTQTQKYTVLRYLGWPLKTIDSTSLSYSNIISDRLSDFPTDAEAMLIALLDRVAAIDTQLQAMVARSNVKSVDDIEFFEDGTYETRRERSKVIREIAVMVDIAMGPGAGGCMINVGI